MTPSLPEIDARLASLTGTSTSIQAKLDELDETIRTLRAARLTGRTAAAWDAVAPRSGELWRHYLAFRGAVQEAVTVRGTRPGASKEQLDDLTRRLLGDSVVLPEDPSTPLSPVLLDPSRSVSMDRAVAVLSSMYEEVAAVANRIVQAWAGAGRRLAELDAALAAIPLDAQRAGIAVPAEVDAVREQLAATRALLGADPLAVDGSVLEGLARRVEEAALSLRHAVAARSGLGDRLAAARRSLDTLLHGLVEASALREEVVVKIAGVAGQVPDLGRLRGDVPILRSRLDAIPRQAGDWEAASRLLDAFDAQVAAVRAVIHGSATACRGWMDRRNELRGLLGGYQAKANARGRGEDPGLASTYERARSCLYSAPCDLAAATGLVEEYRRAVDRDPEEQGT
jgi:hypothetical protein